MSKFYYRYQGNKFLTLFSLMALHDEVIEQSGGRPGVKDRGAVESASNKPKTSVGRADAYPTFFTKVAAQGFELASGHSFTDGNKRTALSAMLWTLAANGFKVKVSDDAQTTVMLLVATGNLEIPGLRVALIHWCGFDVADVTL